MEDIKRRILYYKGFIGHELLLRTIITEMSLCISDKSFSMIRQEMVDIEHNTGQHMWDKYKTTHEQPRPDMELSRVAHSLRIQVAVMRRRVEAPSIWIELLLESLTHDQGNSANNKLMISWVRNLETKVKMAKADVEFLAMRAENQVGAVYSRLAQRDNVTTQKISEATNRDSSAMKSLAVLGALFLPGTFVAALFSLDSITGQPFWVYWVVTIPLTLLVLGVWIFWTHWRSKSVKQQERALDRKYVA
ncbi:hypothetical protein MMC13_000029 [Lambiella insularis]|nr:hypothetical protein [Lambiella insularis]